MVEGASKGKNILLRGLTRREVETIDLHAAIEGVSRNTFAVKALEEKVARDLADPLVLQARNNLRTFRQRLREQS